jgi:nucleotide-binding universal stress UspA family protein
MTIKRLLVPLSSEVDTDSALGSGFLIAEEFNAHLDATFCKFPLGSALLFDDMEGIPVDIIDQRVEEQDNCALQARHEFDAELEARKIDNLKAPIPATKASAAWQVVEEAPFQAIIHGGGSYDLIVVGRSKLDPTLVPRDLIEAALFQTGRPVLVAPAIPPKATGSVILAAWNRSAQSARAFTAAAPFLEVANKVLIFSVTTGAKQGPSANEMGRYLDWHHIKNEVVEVPPDHRPVGEAILDEVNERGVDLIVMGAYSHSRLRELLLGGVTKHILENASLPVLMMR